MRLTTVWLLFLVLFANVGGPKNFGGGGWDPLETRLSPHRAYVTMPNLVVLSLIPKIV